MCLVWVRSVLTETNSSLRDLRAGQARSPAAAARPALVRSARRPAAPARTTPPGVRVCRAAASARRVTAEAVRAAAPRPAEQLRPWRRPRRGTAGRSRPGRPARAPHRARRRRAAVVAAGMVDERPEHPDLHEAAVSPPRRAPGASRSSRRDCVVQVARVAVGPVLGEQQPGQGELVELGQVGRRRRPAATCVLVGPVPRVRQPALGDPQPRQRAGMGRTSGKKPGR